MRVSQLYESPGSCFSATPGSDDNKECLGRFGIGDGGVYASDRGNPWVPYPLAYPTWEKLARQVGFTHTKRLATVPSRFLGEIYAAASW